MIRESLIILRDAFVIALFAGTVLVGAAILIGVIQ